MTIDRLEDLFRARRGHFVFESGHHGDWWLDLELLFLRPRRVAPFATRLAERIAKHQAQAICSPLVEGAFVGLMVASDLELPFTYAERDASGPATGLFPVKYRIPAPLGSEVRGKRVAIINDVINAGSAVRGTLEALAACGAQPAAIGTLLTLGASASRLAGDAGVALEALASRESSLWLPSECPLCREGVPPDARPTPGDVRA